eukprot:scaffold2886_cov398-Prasinococcus_capsulatus_cf.AAC.5
MNVSPYNLDELQLEGNRAVKITSAHWGRAIRNTPWFAWFFGLQPAVPPAYNHKTEPQIYAQVWVQLLVLVVGDTASLLAVTLWAGASLTSTGLELAMACAAGRCMGGDSAYGARTDELEELCLAAYHLFDHRDQYHSNPPCFGTPYVDDWLC